MLKSLLAVAIGGALGTALRFSIDYLSPALALPLGTSTIVINLVGSFVLGLLAAGVWTKESAPDWLKAGIGPGLLGSFTTLSGLMLVGFVDAYWVQGLLVIFIGLLTSLLAALLGIFAGTKLAKTSS